MISGRIWKHYWEKLKYQACFKSNVTYFFSPGGNIGVTILQDFEYKYIWRDRNVSSVAAMIERAARTISII